MRTPLYVPFYLFLPFAVPVFDSILERVPPVIQTSKPFPYDQHLSPTNSPLFFTYYLHANAITSTFHFPVEFNHFVKIPISFLKILVNLGELFFPLTCIM